MRKSGIILVACLAALLARTAPANAEVVTNEKIDFTGFTVFVPCANGGAGFMRRATSSPRA
jgi:hypothetical protein